MSHQSSRFWVCLSMYWYSSVKPRYIDNEIYINLIAYGFCVYIKLKKSPVLVQPGFLMHLLHLPGLWVAPESNPRPSGFFLACSRNNCPRLRTYTSPWGSAELCSSFNKYYTEINFVNANECDCAGWRPQHRNFCLQKSWLPVLKWVCR